MGLYPGKAIPKTSRSNNGELFSIRPHVKRCVNCEHEWDEMHQADGCWFTLKSAAVGANLVCPCNVGRRS